MYKLQLTKFVDNKGRVDYDGPTCKFNVDNNDKMDRKQFGGL